MEAPKDQLCIHLKSALSDYYDWVHVESLNDEIRVRVSKKPFMEGDKEEFTLRVNEEIRQEGKLGDVKVDVNKGEVSGTIVTKPTTVEKAFEADIRRGGPGGDITVTEDSHTLSRFDGPMDSRVLRARYGVADTREAEECVKFMESLLSKHQYNRVREGNEEDIHIGKDGSLARVRFDSLPGGQPEVALTVHFPKTFEDADQVRRYFGTPTA